MSKLNPPQLDRSLPAFFYEGATTTITIPFGLNRAVSANDVENVVLKVKTVSTNIELCECNSNLLKVSEGWAKFKLEFEPTIGQYYKVQIAFKNNRGETGYFSDVGIIKCTAKPTLTIEGLGEGNNNSRYSYTGTYYSKDANEKVYNYYFNIYDVNKQLYESSGILIHNSSNDIKSDSSIDTWTPTKAVKPGMQYTIEYGVVTLNKLEIKVVYNISDNFLINPPTWFDGELHATVCQEEGYIDLTMHGSNMSGVFLLNRSSSKDNFESWQQITKFTISHALDGISIWKDFTIEQGIEYLYSIQMYNSNNIKTIHILAKEYKVMGDFEDMFLSDGIRQLKIRFNPKVSSFKTTRLESKVDTIGSQFPFFLRNGNVEYKEFPISGLISVLSDENSLFILDRDDSNKIRNRTPSGITIPEGAGRTQLTAENMSAERAFKMEVLNWLNNGEHKLFRSPGEGNYIVRLLNVSLSPNDTLGRMIHTFNCQAYECMECNFYNLNKYKYLRIEEEVDYQSQHITSTLDIYNYPFEGLIINGNTVSAQNGWSMHNAVITNMAALGTVEITYNNTKELYSADKFGTCYISKPCTSITFIDDLSLELATLDFDFKESLDSSDWSDFLKIKTVTIKDDIKLENLYNKFHKTIKPTNGIYDYLTYLNNSSEHGQIGDVYYLYVRKRELAVNELASANYTFIIENYENNLKPISAGGGLVYQNVGTLSKLQSGNGFEIDIVYMKKIVMEN